MQLSLAAAGCVCVLVIRVPVQFGNESGRSFGHLGFCRYNLPAVEPPAVELGIVVYIWAQRGSF